MRNNEPMKRYRVLCWRTHYGYYDVDAETEKEAKEKVNTLLWNGVEMDGINDADIGIADTQEQQL